LAIRIQRRYSEPFLSTVSLTVELGGMIGEATQNTKTDGPPRNGGMTKSAATVLAGSPQTNAGDNQSPRRPIDKDALRRCAAAYVRMSTDHQQYSTSNQMDVIREFAKRRGLEIVKLYSDDGKSGLSIQGRDSLSQMIRDVQSGSAGFSYVLVYDVSRWGRFQDADESAYYEYLCRQAGVQVHYCAEQFENDGSPTSTIVKSVKRAMAGEFSRELSNRVFQGACRLIQLGYRQGGISGIGLRRMLVDQNGRHKAVLQTGEHKSIQTDRVIIVPGPDEEIKLVHWIYQMFIDEGKAEWEIARVLNERAIPTDQGRAWTRGMVRSVLTNEKYIGNNVYHRHSVKLKGKCQRNPPEKWIRAEGAFQGIVEPQRFLQARQILQARQRKFQEDEMLARLRTLYQQHGYLTSTLIDQAADLPGSAYISRHFGNLVSLYSLLGFKPRARYSHTGLNRRLFAATADLAGLLTRQITEAGATARWEKRGRMLHLNDELRVCIFFIRSYFTSIGSRRWVVRLRPDLKPDLTILVRMDAKNEAVFDYYLLPSLDTVWNISQLSENNGLYLDAYRFASLEFFVGLAARAQLPKTYERRHQNDSHRPDSHSQPPTPGPEQV
jgi:DNA invertase Pin-like site-specific DNA recombinase